MNEQTSGKVVLTAEIVEDMRLPDELPLGVVSNPIRYRCAKGHEPSCLIYHSFDGHRIAICGHCWIEMLQRECGQVERVEECR